MIAAILGFLGVVFGGIVTWAVARRSKSGKIATSEAETLWTEAREMRGELRLQAQESRAAHDLCEAKLTTANLAIAELNSQVTALQRRVRELEEAQR